MRNRAVACVVLVSLVASGSGCGLMMGGSRQVVRAVSSPEGDREDEPRNGGDEDPAALNLERKNSYIPTFTKEGYTRQGRASAGDAGGHRHRRRPADRPHRRRVDAATGAWYKLSPEVVTVAMEKTADVPGPDRIEVTVRTSGKKHDWLDVTATEPVSVSVEGK
jgi:hypothetical protein